jgi:hypothetical protein
MPSSRDNQILRKAEKVCRSCKTIHHRLAAKKFLKLAINQLDDKYESLRLVRMTWYKEMNYKWR